MEISLGFVGTQPPNYPINTIYLWSSGSEEAVLQVQLKPGTAIRIEDLKERLRQKLPQELAGVRFSFEPSDIVSRVMSFGAPTPIEIAVSGPNLNDSRQYADKLRAKLAQVPTLRDLAFEQELDYPTVKVTVDRERAGVLGVTADDVAKSIVAGTSSSRYTAANYWADPNSGIGYQVQVEIPEQQMNSLEEVKNLPIARRSAQQIEVRNVASVTDGTALGEYDRYNMQRMLTLSANISGEDLGRSAARVQQAISDTGEPPARVNVAVRGQVQPMAEMFGGLRMGLLMAVGVILLLLAANFQSFRLSLAVGLTIPAVIAGVVLMLWLTRTTLEHSILHGRHHGDRGRRGKCHPACHIRRTQPGPGPRTMGGGNRRRTEPPASDPDDQFRDAGRDDSDGARARRRRRTKRAAWACGDRRSPRRNVRHAHHPAGDLGHAPVAARPHFCVARS